MPPNGPSTGAPTPLRKHVDFDPENVRRGLGQLVLTIIELLRQLMERQALRRVRSGSLTPAEIEKLGRSLKALAQEMTTLRDYFHLEPEDLNLDLGPLGKLL